MNIPGLKVLDEIIAGLPTNSAQRLELAKLRSEVALKDRKIEELEAKLAALQPHHGLEVDTVKILKIFFEQAGELSADQIARHLSLSQSVVDYHFDVLCEKEFIMQTGIGFNDSPCGYSIQPKGRAFIIKNKLA